MEGAELLPTSHGVRGLRSLAAAGNALALVLLVLVLARRDVLLGNGAAAPLPSVQRTTPAPASRVLVVVIDALREDRIDGMPHLASLARNGGRGTARVEALVPSTVSGIRALVEGTPPPPASFTDDFGATTAPHGGIFAAVATTGRSSFAAGPRLWADLYGPWLSGAVEVATVRGDDGRVLRAALGALRRHDLVVVHLGAPDDASHLAGAASREYAEAVGRSDAALGELLRRAPAGTAVLVTSDHGVNDRGGHAGPEPVVLNVPVVVHGPGLPTGNLGALRQRDLHRLILRPLGLSLAVPEPPRAVSSWSSWWALLPALLAIGTAMMIWAAVAAGTESPRAGFFLNAALWPALALAFVAPGVAVGLAVAVLVAVWWTSVPGQGVRFLFLLGAALAALRLLDALASLTAPLPLPSSVSLIATAALGIAVGAVLRRLPGSLQGFAAAAVPVLLARLLLGETASLSTLDVRAAFHLVDGPLGLNGAVLAALLRQSLPFLAVLLGLLARPPRDPGGLAAGLGAVLAGQAAVAVLLLQPETEPVGASIALDLLVRLVGEATALFLGSALLLKRLSKRRGSGQRVSRACLPSP